MSNKAKPTSKRSICAVLSTLLFVAMLFSALFLTGCSRKVSDFTEEEHTQRVKEKIDKNFENWGYNDFDMTFVHLEKYELYPLYEANEQLHYFLVECEPDSFSIIFIEDEPSLFSKLILKRDSMYHIDDYVGWSYYYNTNGTTTKLLDDNGENIEYRHSPYYRANCLSERKYLIHTNQYPKGYICAIKKGDGFVNILDDCYFTVENGVVSSPQSLLIKGYIPKKDFDL